MLDLENLVYVKGVLGNGVRIGFRCVCHPDSHLLGFFNVNIIHADTVASDNLEFFTCFQHLCGKRCSPGKNGITVSNILNDIFHGDTAAHFYLIAFIPKIGFAFFHNVLRD